jgi:hypothetical protein
MSNRTSPDADTNTNTNANTNTNTNTDSEEVEYWKPAAQHRDEFNGYSAVVWDYWHNRSHTDDDRRHALDDHMRVCPDCECFRPALRCAELFGIKL